MLNYNESQEISIIVFLFERFLNLPFAFLKGKIKLTITGKNIIEIITIQIIIS